MPTRAPRPTGAMYTLNTAQEIRHFFAARGKHVVSFAGFGELGYEEEGIVERIVPEVVRGRKPGELIINCGTLLRAGGQDGIARAYKVAKSLGIETSGIHPGVALDFSETHYLSPYEDHAFFVEDVTWGGFLEEDQPSPTLQVILDVSHELVVIGGGKHAADELGAFCERGKKVSYFPAEMNRRSAMEWCSRTGVEIGDLRGAAFAVWRSLAPGD
jgi:hypothetical protein